MKSFKWLIPLIICIGSFMIHTNKVNAQIYNISPIETQLNVLNQSNINYNNCANNGCYFFPSSAYQNTNFGNFHLKSGTKSYNNIGLVMFNLALIAPNGASADYNIVDVSWGSFPCYYSVNKGSYYRSSISAYCPISNNVSLNTSTKLANFTITNSLVEQVFLSQMLLISESDASAIIPLLQQSNQYLLNDNNLLSLVNTKLDQLGDKLTTTNSNLSDIKSALNDIKSNASTTASNTEQIKNDIKDSSIDNNNTSSSTSTWSSKNASNGTITNLLTLPISLLQNILNGIQTTCSNFSLGTLFDTELILPCINLSDLIGSTLFNVIDLLFSGFMILNIAKKLIKIFNDFTNLKSNQIDEIYSNGGGSN